MQYSFDGFNYVIRLTKGEQLGEALQQFIKETRIEGAWVSAIGGALDVTLGFYDIAAKTYRWQPFNGLREIVSLSGNLAFNTEGNIVPHLHGVFSDEHYQTVGGHVKDLTAGATVEIFIHKTYLPLQRQTDPEIGLELLDVSKPN